MQNYVQVAYNTFENERGNKVFTFIPGFQTRGFPVHFDKGSTSLQPSVSFMLSSQNIGKRNILPRNLLAISFYMWYNKSAN